MHILHGFTMTKSIDTSIYAKSETAGQSSKFKVHSPVINKFNTLFCNYTENGTMAHFIAHAYKEGYRVSEREVYMDGERKVVATGPSLIPAIMWQLKLILTN